MLFVRGLAVLKGVSIAEFYGFVHGSNKNCYDKQTVQQGNK